MLEDRFLRGSSLLFAATMLGNAFGYLFQLAMGRMLAVEQYGELNALMALLAIFGIPFATLVNFFARETAVHAATGDLRGVRSLHWVGQRWIGIRLAAVVAVMVFLSPHIGGFLDVSGKNVILVLATIFVVGLVTENTGIIQGMQYFGCLSFISAGTSVFKFLFGVLFVWLGWGLLGALGGLLATALCLLLYSQWVIVSHLPEKDPSFRFSWRKIARYVGGLFFANAFFGIMTQMDVILVKHYFPPVDAGLYASAAVLGKAVVYLPGAIVMAMFPMVASNQAAGKSSSSVMIKAVLLTLLLAGSGALCLYIFSGLVLGVLFGPDYLPAVPVAARFGIAMLPLSFVFVVMNYLLAQGRTRFVVFMGAGALLEILGIHFFRSGLSEVLNVILAASGLVLLPMAMVALRPAKAVKEGRPLS